MAQILGGIGTSHVPAIARAVARGEQMSPYWKPFFDGYPPIRRWLAETKPDVAVIFYNDHGLNFFLNCMPTFAIGAAERYLHADEGWGIPVSAPLRGDPQLSWQIIEGVLAADFDLTTCQEMLVDHAVTIPLDLLWPHANPAPVRIVPIAINSIQHPLPSPNRCFALGQAVGAALRNGLDDRKVVIIGSGGLSHQLEGSRAGFINPKFDKLCLDKLSTDPEALLKYSAVDLIELAGSQGVELCTWLAMRGALQHPLELHRHYHAPISNTAGASLLMAEAAASHAPAL
ncbi:MAG TPA: class III extradiol dioxygenase family protein [Caulobacteraceae bacterium]|nr:class III extradiol dioxygenase family protein [Caulobacteraceae bacterium]